MRSKSITFKACLFWFMAHRTRNITVEAFFWTLFELLYGLYILYDEELMVSISTCDAVLDIKHGGGGEGGYWH